MSDLGSDALPNSTLEYIPLSFKIPPQFKSLDKHAIQPPSDDLINIDNGNLGNEQDKEFESTSKIAYITIPIAAIVIIAILTTTVRWRYQRLNTQQSDKKQPLSKNSVNNNNHIESREELLPLKFSNKTEYLENRSTGMQIISEINSIKSDKQHNSLDPLCSIRDSGLQIKEINSFDTNTSCHSDVSAVHSNARSLSTDDLIYEKNPTPTISADVCSVYSTASSNSNKDLSTVEKSLPECDNYPVKPVIVVPLERPTSLSVMTVMGDCHNKSNSNTPTSKNFPWVEQLWTPDADIIYERPSPCVENSTESEGLDKVTPLMGRSKYRMKPKGLLERRGSNVALTISLSAEEKEVTATPLALMKSPKPLVYLRTATALLDPVQLHVKAADVQRLQREYWEIPMNHPSEKHFSIPGYGTKNRYRSILPNPHSRVVLPGPANADSLSTYINANYIRGYHAIKMCDPERRKLSESDKENTLKRRMSVKRKAAFIATQGPMTNTIGDFWKMVWKEYTNTIIMITKLKEQKEKCSQYLPKNVGETEKYEEFTVTVSHIRYANHYNVRTLELVNTVTNSSRTVMHFWYPEWLDHETPEKTRSVLELIQEVSILCPDDNEQAEFGPVVVHCSAGIGRTGCFIAIAMGSMMLQEEGKVDILKIVCHMRMDRGGMIQTWEQYQYVHLALSRFARVLAGENVTTPSTAGSITSPQTGNFLKSPPINKNLSEEKKINVCLPKEEESVNNREECLVKQNDVKVEEIKTEKELTSSQIKKRNFANNVQKNVFNGSCSPITEVPLFNEKNFVQEDMSGSYSPGKRVRTNDNAENGFFNTDDIKHNEINDSLKSPLISSHASNDLTSHETVKPIKSDYKFSLKDTVHVDKLNSSKLGETLTPKTPLSSPPFRDCTNSESPSLRSPKPLQIPGIFTFPSPANN